MRVLERLIDGQTQSIDPIKIARVQKWQKPRTGKDVPLNEACWSREDERLLCRFVALEESLLSYAGGASFLSSLAESPNSSLDVIPPMLALLLLPPLLSLLLLLLLFSDPLFVARRAFAAEFPISGGGTLQ